MRRLRPQPWIDAPPARVLTSSPRPRCRSRAARMQKPRSRRSSFDGQRQGAYLSLDATNSPLKEATAAAARGASRLRSSNDAFAAKPVPKPGCSTRSTVEPLGHAVRVGRGRRPNRRPLLAREVLGCASLDNKNSRFAGALRMPRGFPHGSPRSPARALSITKSLQVTLSLTPSMTLYRLASRQATG